MAVALGHPFAGALVAGAADHRGGLGLDQLLEDEVDGMTDEVRSAGLAVTKLTGSPQPDARPCPLLYCQEVSAMWRLTGRCSAWMSPFEQPVVDRTGWLKQDEDGEVQDRLSAVGDLRRRRRLDQGSCLMLGVGVPAPVAGADVVRL